VSVDIMLGRLKFSRTKVCHGNAVELALANSTEALNRFFEHFETLREHPTNEITTRGFVVVKDRTRYRYDTAPLGQFYAERVTVLVRERSYVRGYEKSSWRFENLKPNVSKT
jgi:hypothetical protein